MIKIYRFVDDVNTCRNLMYYKSKSWKWNEKYSWNKNFAKLNRYVCCELTWLDFLTWHDIEFQKRNLFYIHILIINYSKNNVIATNVNDVVQVVISNKNENSIFYELITIHMIHKSCKNKIDVICHDKSDDLH